ncbi:MAG: hypothetical protein J2O44_01220 [Porphyrobacter sp.]|nr:hypothetical protein [Porphyrobacter sp.]
MTERKPHPDNELIDQMQQDSMPTAQGSASGGNVARKVGSRAELHEAEGQLEGEEVERATGRDNPEDNKRVGAKAREKIRTGQQNG